MRVCEGGDARIDDADEALLAVSALRTVEEYRIGTGDVDRERGELSEAWCVNSNNPDPDRGGRPPYRYPAAVAETQRRTRAVSN